MDEKLEFRITLDAKTYYQYKDEVDTLVPKYKQYNIAHGDVLKIDIKLDVNEMTDHLERMLKLSSLLSFVGTETTLKVNGNLSRIINNAYKRNFWGRLKYLFTGDFF